jgi:nucleotidyltransferase/DNA polymerase involved in DNA repair
LPLGALEYIPAGHEARFLAPLSIKHLPLDAEFTVRLDHLGLRTLSQLAALPPAALQNQFGGVGRLLHTLARGQDVDPVQPYIQPRSIALIQHFDGVVSDRRMLWLAIQQLATRLAARLQRRGNASQAVQLRLELEDMLPWSDSIMLDTPTAQFDSIRHVLGQLLNRASITTGVEAIGIGCAHLTPVVAVQHDLFGQGIVPGQGRRDVIRALITKFGAQRFFSAQPQQHDAPLLEQRFVLQELPLP